ncbi:GNAT family N-acetyltransferase [Noviherbaspirillum aerium]|uniref:GNAT family N-acetyltransferase n=1 Tax=Noviherbaspirillum aerium TaxID=2588497 RepID=UPI00124BEBCF|nr:GNAT family N-acetyltransferase [Noviherbaspirillum aerium]
MFNELSVACFENEVPSFVESAMERLYGNIFSSLLEFKVYGWVAGTTSTYVVSENGEIRTLLLFKKQQRKVQVLNEGICLQEDEMRRFSNFIFSKYEDVDAISFKAIETDMKRLSYPHQRFNHLEDLTLKLPPGRESYLASLGKNTRRNIKRYTERLQKTFPSYQFNVYEAAAIREEDLRAMIEFNRRRMAGKNIESVIDEEETRRIITLAKACGLVGIATIDGRIAAGALSFRAGQNYFLNVLAHDPCYDDYWIGFLCCYQTVCECIERGGDEFHFLWGRYDYKFTLGAVQRDLDNVTVYRSRIRQILHPGLAWTQAKNGYLRQTKVWLKYGETDLAHQARHVLKRVRDMKRAAGSIVHGRTAT